MKVLAGDLGGTKALFGIAELVDDKPYFLLTRRLASADFSGTADLLAHFVADAGTGMNAVGAACLAVAGPVSEDGCRARFTNLPWQVDAAELKAQLGVPVRLVNDFAAVAAGVTVSAPGQLVTLQPGQPDPAGVRLAIGAGTGLGVAAMLGRGNRLHILPGEGGHIGFSPQNAAQMRIHAALLAEHGRVTNEQVISGPGLAAIHRILAAKSRAPAEIAELALAGDPEALATTDVFFAAYGAFAGDLAMSYLARGGVFLAGGVTQRLLPLLADSPFLAAFNAKMEHASLAADMPVQLVTDPDVGLVGAALQAYSKQT